MSESGADYRHFFCTSCGAKLKAKASTAGKQLPCPKCATLVVIPGPPTSSPASLAGGLREPQKIPNTSDIDQTEGDTYGVRAPEETLRPIIAAHEHSGPVRPVSPDAIVPDNNAESYTISDISAERDEEPEGGRKKHRGLILEPSVRPTLPRWPLLQGVLGFFLDPGAIVFWLVLSFWGTICVSLLTAAIVLADNPSIPTWMGSVFAHGITGVAGSIWIIVNSGCCLAILQESAAGNRTIEEWPGFALVDLFLESFYIINSTIFSVAAAWFLTAPLAGIAVLRAFCEVGLFLIVFPIVLLSMLEAGSCLMPVSSAVYAGLRRSRRTWLMFFIESLVLAFGLMIYIEFVLVLLDHYSAHVTIQTVFLAMAPLVAPAVLLEMIYFRLLGRLAWVCDEDARREQAEEEEAEEEEKENPETTEIRPVPVDDF